jgi:hypothetical protein
MARLPLGEERLLVVSSRRELLLWRVTVSENTAGACDDSTCVPADVPTRTDEEEAKRVLRGVAWDDQSLIDSGLG